MIYLLVLKLTHCKEKHRGRDIRVTNTILTKHIFPVEKNL